MIKLLGVTLLVGLLGSVNLLVTGAALLAAGGIAICSVHAEDVDLDLPIPTQLMDAGLIAARFALPEDERARMRVEVGPWLPMIQRVARAIAELPDGTVLVSVETRDESVRVQRRDGRLAVDVRAPDADVHVSLPARSAKRIVGQLAFLM
jgi:hypothetical protein